MNKQDADKMNKTLQTLNENCREGHLKWLLKQEYKECDEGGKSNEVSL